MPVKIFICYARKDERLLDKLKKHLRLLQNKGLIDLWHDRNISAGSQWEREIDQRLNSAGIILLLVSPDFMDSHYSYGVEMKQAMERQKRGEATVIPVILRPVDWKDAPFGKLQALPTDSKPVTTWANKDNAFLNIAKGIREVVEKLTSQAKKMKEIQSDVPLTEEKHDIQRPFLFHNEEDVKIKLVVEHLKSLGFDERELLFEKSFFLKMGKFSYKVETEQQVDAAQARLDILISREGKNLFIVEVKSADISIGSADIDQAVSYARLVHPIAPVCIITNGKEWKIIDSITKADISGKNIVTAVNYTPALPDEAYYEATQHFLGYSRRNLLQFFQHQVPDAMKVLRGLEDEETKKYAEDERMKKYVKAVYEPRKQLSAVFAKFVQSDSRCFIVTGNSGSGKSCWACDTALRYLQSHHVVLFYRSSDIEKGIFQAICEDLNWAFSPHYDEVQAVKRLLEVLQQDCILVFVDGLDEMPIDLAIKTTDEFLKRVDGQRMKLIATCKTTVWNDFLKNPIRLSNDVFKVDGSKGYVLSPFDDQEFFHVIEKYRTFYQYFGLFETEAYERCRYDPFLLRVMFEVASEQRLPNISYTAINFFREYFLQLCSRFESSQRSMIQHVLIETAKCLYIHNADEIDETELKASLDLSVTDSLPHRLFELNILERHDHGDIKYIGFYFKKLRDYLIAFRALRWETLSLQAFSSAIEKGEVSGIRLEVLNLFYSLTSSEEHKRVLDGQLYAKASAFLSLYEEILDTNFPAIKRSFPSTTAGPIGFVGYVDFSQNAISGHGFRPLKNGEAKVLLIPTASIPGAWASGNKGFLAGSLRMHRTDSSHGFQSIDIVDEVFSHNVQPSVKEILRQGKLDESQNKELLIERVLAICATYCQNYFQKYRQNASHSYLPLCLKDLRQYVLYEIAHAVLTLQYTDRGIASSQSQEVWRGGIHVTSVVLSAQEQAEIEEQAWMTAKQGKNMAQEREQLLINDGAFLSLLEDIDNLKQLHIDEIRAIGNPGLMERPHSSMALEAKVVIEAHRGMTHQHHCHFPALWSASVCGLFLRTTHTGDGLAAL